MMKTLLSAACAAALLAAGGAYAQSGSNTGRTSPTPGMSTTTDNPQSSTVKDPARMEKPGWSQQSGANTQAYPSKSGTPSAFDKAEKKAMDGVSGARKEDRMGRKDDRMGRDRSNRMSDRSSGSAAGASSSALAPECANMAREEEVTRCLNRHMADMAQRGETMSR